MSVIHTTTLEDDMAKSVAKKSKSDTSVYKVIELVGTSKSSWADAAKNAVTSASKTLRDIRVAEVSKLDLKVGKNGDLTYRAKMKLSFKYHGD
jgi:dodecin